MSSSEKYEILKDDLEALFEKIESSLHSFKVVKSTEQRRCLATRIRSDLAEAQRYISEIEAEARAAPITFRGDMLGKVRQFRESNANFHANFRKLNEKLMTNVPFMNVTGEAESQSQEDQLRKQVLKGARILEQTTQSIERSQRVALESEAVGGEILTDLSQQRESLERSRAMLQEADSELSRSRRVLRRIAIATVQSKILLIIVIIVQLIIISALVYWKWFSK